MMTEANLVCTIDTFSATLDKYGVAIIEGIFDSDASDALLSGIISTLETLTGDASQAESGTVFRVGDKDTWTNLYKLRPRFGYDYNHFGLAHAQPLWNVRVNTDVLKVFRKFFGTYDLACSFEGFGFLLPPETTKKGYQTKTKTAREVWRHGQPPKYAGCTTAANLQGYVSACPIESGDATKSVLLGSHKHFEAFMQTFGSENTRTEMKITDNMKTFYTNLGCSEHQITHGAGALVVWDTRLATRFVGVDPARKSANTMCVANVTYVPNSVLSDKAIEKRHKAFAEKRTLSHLVAQETLPRKNPPPNGNVVPTYAALPVPVLPPESRCLLGVHTPTHTHTHTHTRTRTRARTRPGSGSGPSDGGARVGVATKGQNKRPRTSDDSSSTVSSAVASTIRNIHVYSKRPRLE